MRGGGDISGKSQTLAAVARGVAHAKVNLTLKILGVRADGFHALRSIVMPLALHDDVEVRMAEAEGKPSAANISVETLADGVDCSALCAAGDNLCAKAVRAFLARLPDDNRLRRASFAIRVVKRIPLGGGLGGGSADAAAVLRILDSIAGHSALGEAALLDAASEIGSDVPALLLGGPVLMEGRGEKVSRLDPAHFAPLPVVLANPGIPVSTPAAYTDWDRLASGRASIDSSSCEISGSGAFSSAERYGGILSNDLQAPVFAKYPQVSETARLLRAAGAHHVLMSGSGATVFAITDTPDEAERIAIALSPQCWTCATRLI